VLFRSLLAPRTHIFPAPALRLRLGLLLSGFSALLSLLPLTPATAWMAAFLIGAGLGLLTVTLVTHLRSWTGDRQALFKVGLGTGIGYFICNIPPLFRASSSMQAITSGVLCLAALAIPLPAETMPDEQGQPQRRSISFALALVCFTALVWLDSAAFFIIQHIPALKAATWQGDLHLWMNGLLHLGGAMAGALLLRRFGTYSVLCGAILFLGIACLLLHDPFLAVTASVFYPLGVSLYSVALVAYPSLLVRAGSTAERARIAGWIYAIAGWAGSAMGIGMAQHLGRVPAAFIAVAGGFILFPALLRLLRSRTRELIAVTVVLLLALGIDCVVPHGQSSRELSAIERGRQVYISEGCIHCHSQYVRPHTQDVLLWGPAQSLDAVHRLQPPLIGNRRQGPDLAQIGNRRSPLWIKAHFFDPREVSGASIMPSYAILFRDQRGDDLVAYLSSLHSDLVQRRLDEQRTWRPSAAALDEATAEEGECLVQRHCATCHDANGKTRIRWKSQFELLPPDLAIGPFALVDRMGTPRQRIIQIAQIAKFGIANTDMPGHEYLSDREVASIGLWLTQNMAQPSRNHPLPQGDHP
jgi:cytochrome c oxidase cbb3-type subunit 2